MKIRLTESELKRIAKDAITEVITEDVIQPTLIDRLKSFDEERLAVLWNGYAAGYDEREIWDMDDFYNVIADTPNGDEMVSDDFNYNDRFFYGEFINNGKEARYHSANSIFDVPFFSIEELAKKIAEKE